MKHRRIFDDFVLATSIKKNVAVGKIERVADEPASKIMAESVDSVGRWLMSTESKCWARTPSGVPSIEISLVQFPSSLGSIFDKEIPP